MKKVIKEIAIVLLLCIAIILVLGLLFYQYIPTNKIVPNKVAYKLPENIAQELNNDVDEAGFVNITYTLDSSEIKQSEKKNEYDPGRQDPFAAIEQENQTNNVTGNSSAGGNTAGNSNTSGNTNTTDEDSEAGSYLPTGGAK